MGKDEIYDMFINEIAGKKEVEVEDFKYNIALNYNITDTKYEKQSSNIDDSLPSIHINNVDLFKEKLNEYISSLISKKDIWDSIHFDSDESKTKYLTAMLFANATCEDFENPYEYIDKCLAALEDKTFDSLKEEKNICKLSSFKDANLKVKATQQSIFLETPQKLEFSLSKQMDSGEEYTVPLPSVSCFCYQKGKNKILNISAIQNKKIDRDKEKNVFEKQVNREKFKLNDGIEKEEQDVEPLSILSLATTILLAKQNGATKVRMPDFMPIRWYALGLVNEKKSKSKNLNLEELQEEQLRIQHNITNKFLRTMIRIEEQMGMVNVSAVPGVSGNYLECNITDKQVDSPNKILKEIADSIESKKEKKSNVVER